jgi:hypothetical protein
VSVFYVDKLLHQIPNRAAWQAFLESADDRLRAGGFELTPVEREALLSGDVRRLYELGINGYLLLRYAAWHGYQGEKFLAAVGGRGG